MGWTDLISGIRPISLTALTLFAAFTFGFVLLMRLIGRYGSEYRKSFSRSVGEELGKAFVFINPNRLFVLNVGLLTSCSLITLALFRHPLPAFVVALVFAVLPRLALTRLRTRRIRLFRQQLPEVIAVVAGGIRSGASLTGALADVAAQLPAPASQEISLVLRQSRMGSTLDQAIADLEKRMPTEETVLLVSALRIGGKSGGSVASVLDSLADSIRRKLVLEEKIRALTAQGRMQAWVMGLLPLLVLVAVLTLDSSLAVAYFGQPLGWGVLGSVVLLQLLGGWLIRRIVNIEI